MGFPTDGVRNATADWTWEECVDTLGYLLPRLGTLDFVEFDVLTVCLERCLQYSDMEHLFAGTDPNG